MRISDWSSDVCSSDLSADASLLKVSWPESPMAQKSYGAPRHNRRGPSFYSSAPATQPQSRSKAPARRHHAGPPQPRRYRRSEEHTSELQSLMRISYAVFCLKKKNKTTPTAQS